MEISILHAVRDALFIGALFHLPGAAWSWTLQPRSRLEHLGCSLAIALPAVLLPAILLAECGLFSLRALIAVALLFGIPGFLLGPARGRDTLAGFAVIAAALALLLSLPARGAWVAGGWDPGVNLNQGLLLARTGGVAQPPDPLLAAIHQEAPDAFTRTRAGLVEPFPGIPMDPDTGALRPSFYRATPTLVAILAVLAGDHAAFRVNHLAGICAILLLFSLLAQMEFPRPAILASVALFAAQPILLAHLSNPASELLELALVCATALLLRKHGVHAAIILFAVLLLGALNRVSFIFHQSLLLLVLVAWETSTRDRRLTAQRQIAIAAAIAASLAWYTWVNPPALAKLGHLLPSLHGLAALAIAAALTLNSILFIRRRALPSWTRALVLLVPAALLIRESLRHDAWLEAARNLPAWIAYSTPAVALAGVLGLLIFAARSACAPLAVWLGSALLIVLLRRHAAELYPWATKRWLSFSPPLLALGMALLFDAMNRRLPAPRWRWAASGGLAVILLALGAPLAREAWRAAEYDQLPAALQTLAHRLEPGDLVVADHFRWGTPLALAHGHAVLNAEPLLAGLGQAEDAARALARSKRRIVLLPSTKHGLAAWPAPFQHAQPLGEPLSFSATTRIQHPKNRGFRTQDERIILSTAIWEPGP